MVDPQRVRSKLTTLDTLIDELRDLAAMDRDTYVAQHRWEGRYLVQAAAQLTIDLANHLIASSGWAPATEFRQAFTRLGEHGVIDADLVDRLQALTGLRNRLVHLYDTVDDGLVLDALRAGLDDFATFASAYARHALEGDD